MGLRRANGDDPVAVQLRQEVHFRCPVPGCGYPILTYHHFDPPWNVREHNEPEGMIALCHVCHDKADGTGGGLWTKEQLRTFKRSPPNHPPTQETLLFLEPSLSPLYRIGGNYLLDTRYVVFSESPIVWQTRSPDGTVLFSFDLRGEDGATALMVRENSLSIDDLKVWDFRLNTRGNHLLVKPQRGQIALDLHLKRYSLAEVSELMKKDSVKSFPPEIGQRCVNSDGDVLLIDFRTAELYVRPNLYLPVRSGEIRMGRDGGGVAKGNYICDGGIGFEVW
jgi:hypothetical protein